MAISQRKAASGQLIGESISLFMLAVVLITFWAARGARLRQIVAAVGTSVPAEFGPDKLKLSAPGTRLHEPRPWKLVARKNRGSIAVYLLLVCFAVAGVILISNDRMIDPTIEGTLVGLDFVALIVWPVIAPARYLKPGDLNAIAQFEPGAQVWISTTTAGMKAYAERYFDSMGISDRRLRSAGFVALTSREIQFWQRQRDELLLICEFSRDDISDVAKDDVPWTIVVQSGVILTVERGDHQLQVPLLLANARPSRKSPAVDEFLASWAEAQ